MNLIKKGIYTLALLLSCLTISTSQCTLIPNSCGTRGIEGPNLLANGSFEDNTPGLVGAGGFEPGAAGWNFFGAGFNQFIEEFPNPFSPCGASPSAQPAPRTGGQLLKLFGQFNGGFNATGAFSDLFPVIAGETYIGGVYMLSPQEAVCPIDHIQEGIFSEVHIEFFDADGVCLFTTSEQFTAAEANGSYMQMRTISIAPPGAVTAQLNILFFQPQFQGGAIYYDDAYVSRIDGDVAPAVSGLACNDHVNISANPTCGIQLSTDALLEGDYDDFFYDFQITNSVGAVVDVDDVADFVGQTLTFTVSELCGINSCWGNITIEDKSIPEINCGFCPEGGLGDIDGDGVIDYSPECQLMCYELPYIQLNYWENLLDALIPRDAGDFAEDNVRDNCATYGESDISVFDVINESVCDGTILKRTFTLAYDQPGGGLGYVSCTREYFFAKIDTGAIIEARFSEPLPGLFIPEIIEDTLLLPKRIVEVPTCNVGTDPASLQAFFNNPPGTDFDTDDNNIDPDEFDVDLIEENNSGTWYAYPHYYVLGRGIGPAPTGPHAQAVDNEVCNIVTGFTDQLTTACAEGCMGNNKTVRTWTVLDWCTGEFISYEQIIKVVDDIAPVLTIDGVTTSVDPWKCSADVLLPLPEHLSDNCDADLTYEVVSVQGGLQVAGDAATGYIIRDVPIGTTTVRLEAADCCGNVTKTDIILTVADNTPPVAITKEFVVTSLTNVGNPVQGDENGVAKLFATSIDNGSYDSCTPVTIEIRRTDSPCASSEEDLEWGEFVKFCCADVDGQEFVLIDVEFRVTDLNGNANLGWTTVRLEDKSTPAPFCPEPLILTCEMDINDFSVTGIPEVFGACGPIDLMIDFDEVMDNTEPRDKLPGIPPLYFFNPDGSPSPIPVAVPAYNPSCGFGAIRRQWRSEGCDQWFVITPIDEFDETTIEFPADITVDCDDYETGEPTWLDPVCNLVGFTLESDTFRFEDNSCFKIINRWSVIDWCTYDPSNPTAGGRYEGIQTIKLIDTVDPVVSVPDSLCFAVNQECTSKGVVLTGSAVDNGDCGSDWIGWEVVIDAFADWVPDFTYTTSTSQLVDGEPNPFYIPKSGNGEEISIVLPDGIMGSKVWHRAVWRAYDGCNNTSSVTRYFQIADKKAPTPYCLNLSSAVMQNGQVELWAIDFNVGSFDNCSDQSTLLYTFTDVPPPPRCDEEYDRADWYDTSFWYYDSAVIEDDATDNDCDIAGFGEYMDQGDYGGDVHRWEPGLRSSGRIFTIEDADASGFVQVPIYVWDECGNLDFCLVNLRLVDNGGGGSARIAGSIRTEFGETVENVMTNLGGPVNVSMMEMTDSNGEFAFTDIPMFTDYRVSGEKNDDYLNGVSTLDIVLLQKHILGQELLQSPYAMIAADINADRSITAIDLISLRKLILGIYEELPDNGSWKFVDASQGLTTSNPWLYSESRDVLNLEDDMLVEDFVGVKIGDLNNSVTLGLAGSEIDKRNANSVDIMYTDRTVEQGSIVELVLSTQREDVQGYQFTLETSGLELQTVSGRDITEGNIGVHNGRITMSYGSVTSVEKGDLVTLTFKSTVSGQLSDILSLSNSITRTEAYVGNNLEEVAINLRGGESTSNFELYQNQPNPFSVETVIGFELPESGSATLSLFDVTGKVLRVIEGDYAQGYNEVKLTKSDLSSTGMIYYKLQTQEHTATRHMMIVE